MKIGNVTIKSNVILAPMAGYGDVAFRRLCCDYGAGLTTTEMVSVKGLCYDNDKTKELLMIAPNESVSCVQLFGGEAKYFEQALKMDCLAGFNIIDINFGCPVLKVTKNGEGSALMKDVSRAASIMRACVKGACGRPVTAKFRLGWDEENLNAAEFARAAESEGISAITIHGRTTKQMYSGVADWQQISETAASVKIPVFGNGDITGALAANHRLDNSGCAGISIGRGALGHPQIFAEIANRPIAELPDSQLPVIIKHIDYMLEYFPPIVTVRAMRKHLPHYLKGIPQTKELKQELNYITDVDVLKDKLIKTFNI